MKSPSLTQYLEIVHIPSPSRSQSDPLQVHTYACHLSRAAITTCYHSLHAYHSPFFIAVYRPELLKRRLDKAYQTTLITSYLLQLPMYSQPALFTSSSSSSASCFRSRVSSRTSEPGPPLLRWSESLYSPSLVWCKFPSVFLLKKDLETRKELPGKTSYFPEGHLLFGRLSV